MSGSGHALLLIRIQDSGHGQELSVSTTGSSWSAKLFSAVEAWPPHAATRASPIAISFHPRPGGNSVGCASRGTWSVDARLKQRRGTPWGTEFRLLIPRDSAERLGQGRRSPCRRRNLEPMRKLVVSPGAKTDSSRNRAMPAHPPRGCEASEQCPCRTTDSASASSGCAARGGAG